MNAASGPTRNETALATSSGWQGRPSGTVPPNFSLASDASPVPVNLVSKPASHSPGATALARMLCAANSGGLHARHDQGSRVVECGEIDVDNPAEVLVRYVLHPASRVGMSGIVHYGADLARIRRDGTGNATVERVQDDRIETEIYRRLRHAISRGCTSPAIASRPNATWPGDSISHGASCDVTSSARKAKGRSFDAWGAAHSCIRRAPGQARRRRASPVDVMEARMVIEPGLADLVVSRASAGDFVQMDATLAEMAETKSQQEFREVRYQFRTLLAQSTRILVVVHFFKQMVDARIAAGWGRLKDLNSTEQACREWAAMNRAIPDAMKSRDADLSRRLQRKHLGRMVASVSFQQESWRDPIERD